MDRNLASNMTRQNLTTQLINGDSPAGWISVGGASKFSCVNMTSHVGIVIFLNFNMCMGVYEYNSREVVLNGRKLFSTNLLLQQLFVSFPCVERQPIQSCVT